MGDKYIITGVQLGLLIALQTPEEREEVVNDIIDVQFISSGDKESVTGYKKVMKGLNKLRSMRF